MTMEHIILSILYLTPPYMPAGANIYLLSLWVSHIRLVMFTVSRHHTHQQTSVWKQHCHDALNITSSNGTNLSKSYWQCNQMWNKTSASTVYSNQACCIIKRSWQVRSCTQFHHIYVSPHILKFEIESNTVTRTLDEVSSKETKSLQKLQKGESNFITHSHWSLYY